MSARIVTREWGPNKGKSLLCISTAVEVQETVDVDVDLELEEFVAGLTPQDRIALQAALSKAAPPGPAVDGGIRPDDAYYALARGDMDTVRRFVCECAGRIA